MIPHRLLIKGLYSYQEEQEINFRQLVGTDVFGIFGKVGSGKTSLLEAISFALYGETERLNGRDNRAYNMMNLKSKQMKIDFEFEAGPDAKQYKFIYEAKRNGKQHADVKAGERRMFVQENGEWQPLNCEKDNVATLTEQIIGLNYDNFKRTIIIPQNQFREFLELPPTERTAMMRRLFRLDDFDLYRRTTTLEKQNDEALATLQGLMSPLGNVTPETLQEAETALAVLKQDIAAQNKRINTLQPIEQQLLQAKQQTETLRTVREHLAQLETQQPAISAREQYVLRYEQCQQTFQHDFTTFATLQARLETLQTEKQNAEAELTRVTAQLPHLRAAFEQAKTAYDTREHLREQIEELDSAQEIRNLWHSLKPLHSNRREFQIQVDRLSKNLTLYRNERAQHQAFLASQRTQTSQMERLFAVEKWFLAYKPLCEEADKLERAFAQHEWTKNDLKRQKDAALRPFPATWTAHTLKTLPGIIDQYAETLKAELKQHEDRHQKVLVQAELQRYAQNLVEGEPCPLCGATHHATGHALPFENADVVRSKQAVDQLRGQLDDVATLQLVINTLKTKLMAELENEKRTIQERDAVIRQKTAHEDEFAWPEFSKDNQEPLHDALEQERQRLKQLENAQRSIQELNADIETHEKQLEEQKSRLSKLDTQAEVMRVQIEEKLRHLKHYEEEQLRSWNVAFFADERDRLETEYSKRSRAYEKAEQARQQAEKQELLLAQEVKNLTQQQDNVVQDVALLEKEIDKNLHVAGLTRAEVSETLRSTLNVAAERHDIQQFYVQQSAQQQQAAQIEALLAEQPFNAELLHETQAQLQTLRAEKDALNQQFGKIEGDIKTLQTQLSEKAEHLQRLESLTLRRQDLETMKKLFTAEGFVNYVSGVHLRQLCASANERFYKLTNNQLKLEVDDKNAFVVRDFLHGGTTRSVKTLSGGQMFQAALSLALALSDNVQHLTKAKQHLFFLDEGFGTLDKEALQTVFQTLKSLKREGRVVGIISHVEELQQEVEHYIVAENTARGSRIKSSWEVAKP